MIEYIRRPSFNQQINIMRIGLIREEKIPSDQRVVLDPAQCAAINATGEHVVVVQRSPDRCFPDEAYQAAGVTLVDDVSDCELLIGVKEVPLDRLIEDKTYFFFSHTTKQQPYNRDLLRTILDRRIRLIDYEHLTDESGKRVIAFGRFAGMVGAHNGVLTYGSRTGLFALRPMHSFDAYAESKATYKTITWPPIRIVLTGSGRVGSGAAEVLEDMDFVRVSSEDFLADRCPSDRPCFVQIDANEYTHRIEGGSFVKQEFYNHPNRYAIDFKPYYSRADIMINGIYWDSKAPAFFTSDEMSTAEFKIQVIADITCDIAPEASVPSTLRASTIEEPVFGYDPVNHREVDPYMPGAIDVMSVDNLPNELARDASTAFGDMFIKEVLPHVSNPAARIIREAQITTVDGQLSSPYRYLADYVAGE